jgi:hypothetical protein
MQKNAAKYNQADQVKEAYDHVARWGEERGEYL